MVTKVNGKTSALLFTVSLLIIGIPSAWMLYSKFQANEQYLQANSLSTLHEMSTHLDNKIRAVRALFGHIKTSSDNEEKIEKKVASLNIKIGRNPFMLGVDIKLTEPKKHILKPTESNAPPLSKQEEGITYNSYDDYYEYYEKTRNNTKERKALTTKIIELKATTKKAYKAKKRYEKEKEESAYKNQLKYEFDNEFKELHLIERQLKEYKSNSIEDIEDIPCKIKKKGKYISINKAESLLEIFSCESKNKRIPLYSTINTKMILKGGSKTSPFDLILLTTQSGDVIGTLESEVDDIESTTPIHGSHIKNIKDLLLEDFDEDAPDAPKNTDINGSLSINSVQVFDTVIGSQEYKLYIMPYKIPITVIPDSGNGTTNKNQSDTLLLAGLIPEKEANASKYSLSPSVTIIMIGLVLLLIALWPILRIKYMGVNQSLSQNEFRFALVGFALFSLLFTLASIDAWTYHLVKKQIYQQLNKFSQEVVNEISGKLDDKKELLNALIDTQFGKATTTGNNISSTTEYTQCMKKAMTRASYSKRNIGSIPCWDSRSEVSLSNTQPIIDHYFLINNKGRQIGPILTWYPLDLENRRLRVHKRPYFKRIMQGDAWPDDNPDKPVFYQQHIISYTNGMQSTITSLDVSNKQCEYLDTKGFQCFDEEETPAVAVVEYNLKSLLKPILPLGYRLAVINGENGMVLFHSNPKRNLLENFLIETDHKPAVKLAIKNRNETTLHINYHGTPHYAAFRSIQNTPWTLVVLYDKNQLQLLNFNVVFVTFIGMLVVLFCLGFVFWATKLLTPSISWLWPNPKKTQSYLTFILLFVLSAVQASIYGFCITDSPLFAASYCMLLTLFNWSIVALKVAHAPRKNRLSRWLITMLFYLVSLSLVILTLSSYSIESTPLWTLVAITTIMLALLIISFLSTFLNYNGLPKCRVRPSQLYRIHPIYFTGLLSLIIVIPTAVLFKQVLHQQALLYSSVSSNQLKQDIKSHINAILDRFEVLYQAEDNPNKNNPEKNKPSLFNKDFSTVKKHWFETTNKEKTCPDGMFGFYCTIAGDTLGSSDSLYHANLDIAPDRNINKNNDQKINYGSNWINLIFSRITPSSKISSQIAFYAEKNLRENQRVKSIKVTRGIPYTSTTSILILTSLIILLSIIYLLFRSIADRCLGLTLMEPLPHPLIEGNLLDRLQDQATNINRGILVIHPSRNKQFELQFESRNDPSIFWYDLAESSEKINSLLAQRTSNAHEQEKSITVICYNSDIMIHSPYREAALETLSVLAEGVPNTHFLLWCERSPLYRLIKHQAYDGTTQTKFSDAQRWINLFSLLRKFYVGQHPQIELENLSSNIKERLKQLSEHDAQTWPDLLPVDRDFKAWIDKIDSNNIEESTLVSWYTSNAGAIYRRKWELCTQDEKVALYQLAMGHYINCHNMEIIEHLERGGYITRDPRLHLRSHSFERFVLAAERPDTMEIWLQESSIGSWDIIRIPLLTLLLVAIGTMLYLFGSELKTIAPALAVIPAVLAVLIRGAAFIKGAPPTD